jgi:threonine dehydratase
MIRPTTFIRSLRLNHSLGAEVILASETFQHTGNFKFRAAWHLVSHVPNDHVITASSGNFGQALAMACRERQKRCTVVMPRDSVQVKVEAVREFGGCVDLIDVDRISSERRVAELLREYPDAYLADSSEDELVIEGNSTLAVELVALAEAIDVIAVPIGGGA